MEKKKVVILGASRYHTKNIEAARNAGYFVIALDRNPGSPGFAFADLSFPCDISDPEGVLAIAREHKVSGIVPLNDVGVPVAAYVSTRLGLPGISPEVAELASNKKLMRQRWIEKGIPCPKVFVATTREEFLKGFDYVGFPCILKPAHGLGGASRGVIVLESMDEADAAISFTQSFYEDKTTLIESFIQAEIEHSAEVLIYNGEASVIAIADKVKTPLPYRVDKNVLYPTSVTGEKLDELKTIVKEAVQALEINIGAAHVELASTKGGYVLFELGARCGGGGTPEPIVTFATGVNEFVQLVKILAGDKPDNLLPIRNNGVNYHFITPRPGKIAEISGLEQIQTMDGVLDFGFFKSPGDLIPEVKTGQDRSGFIITGALSREEALRIGQVAEDMIKISYE